MKRARGRRQDVPGSMLVSPHCGTAQYSHRMLGLEVKHQGRSLIPPGFLQELSEFFSSGITSTDRRCWCGSCRTRGRSISEERLICRFINVQQLLQTQNNTFITFPVGEKVGQVSEGPTVNIWYLQF